MVSFKRRIMAAVLSVIMVISCFAGMTFSVSAETVGDYEYETIDSSTVKIKRYNGSDADVVIPAEIDGKKVTVIGEYSFCDNASLNKVSIPDGITDIEYGAFIGCSSLV